MFMTQRYAAKHGAALPQVRNSSRISASKESLAGKAFLTSMVLRCHRGAIALELVLVKNKQALPQVRNSSRISASKELVLVKN
jgi:hypothetical protein